MICLFIEAGMNVCLSFDKSFLGEFLLSREWGLGSGGVASFYRGAAFKSNNLYMVLSSIG